jgi:uncharacterized protein
MTELSHLFKIVVSKDHMNAELHYTDEYLVKRDITSTSDSFREFLIANKIVFGINDESIAQLLSGIPLEDFPLQIAKGEPPIPGLDGKIDYYINFNPQVEQTESWNFREVMRIPSVKNGAKLATISLPTEGKEGKDVFGNVVPAIPGKPVKVKAGKNVKLDEISLTFYADSEGQANVQGNYIHVHPVFEVTNTLSMKEGNLDFIGTIVIQGDVPSGYTLTAGGDIKIFGTVEAATIRAKGSVYVAEGLSGIQKGIIDAGENIQISYVNQGIIHAGNNIYVENYILHSDCVAGSELICQRGSIIGGHVSARDLIQVKHVGNYVNIRTELILGQNHFHLQKVQELELQKKEIEDTLAKLTVIGKKLSNTTNIEDNPKLLLTLQKQKASYDQHVNLLNAISEELISLNHGGNERYAKLTVTGNLYGNTIVTFGKYKRIIDESYKQVELELLRNEIYMRAL